MSRTFCHRPHPLQPMSPDIRGVFHSAPFAALSSRSGLPTRPATSFAFMPLGNGRDQLWRRAIEYRHGLGTNTAKPLLPTTEPWTRCPIPYQASAASLVYVPGTSAYISAPDRETWDCACGPYWLRGRVVHRFCSMPFRLYSGNAIETKKSSDVPRTKVPSSI